MCPPVENRSPVGRRFFNRSVLPPNCRGMDGRKIHPPSGDDTPGPVILRIFDFFRKGPSPLRESMIRFCLLEKEKLYGIDLKRMGSTQLPLEISTRGRSPDGFLKTLLNPNANYDFLCFFGKYIYA